MREVGIKVLVGWAQGREGWGGGSLSTSEARLVILFWFGEIRARFTIRGSARTKVTPARSFLLVNFFEKRLLIGEESGVIKTHMLIGGFKSIN